MKFLLGSNKGVRINALRNDPFGIVSLIEQLKGEKVKSIKEVLEVEKEQEKRRSSKVTNYVDELQSSGILMSYTDILREERRRKFEVSSSQNGSEGANSGHTDTKTASLLEIEKQLATLKVKARSISVFASTSSDNSSTATTSLAIPDSAKVPRILAFQSPPDARLLKLGILGLPNTGKSTFINRFFQAKVSITSSKAQTTRHQVIGMKTTGNEQIVMYDTPGLPPPHIKLKRNLAVVPWQTLRQVDSLLFFCNALQLDSQFNSIRYYLKRIEEILQKSNDQILENNPSNSSTSAADPTSSSPTYQPPGTSLNTRVSLVMNMMDRVITEKQQKKIQQYESIFLSEFPSFLNPSVFKISSKSGFGMAFLQEYLEGQTLPRPWLYSPNQRSLLSDVEIILETIREQLYRRLNQEIPYLIATPEIVSWKESQLELILGIQLSVGSGLAKMVVGKDGSVVNFLKEKCDAQLSASFAKKVSLFIHVASSGC